LAIFELLVTARGAIIIRNSDARRRRRSAAGKAGTAGHGTRRRRVIANSHEILRPGCRSIGYGCATYRSGQQKGAGRFHRPSSRLPGRIVGLPDQVRQ
jgi:hypothetical protein